MISNNTHLNNYQNNKEVSLYVSRYAFLKKLWDIHGGGT